MPCGEWCVYYKSSKTEGVCRTCRENESVTKPRNDWGKVDVFDLARKLQEREKAKHE